ncbi:hypothetical protein M9458_053118 [Cirrhinus mrigala]|uniref:Uncharacterized protein n=1 Tax=Cirrhinus mrigala TaxID=683832 RepID=A0ABD0MRM4_CIRMR
MIGTQLYGTDFVGPVKFKCPAQHSALRLLHLPFAFRLLTSVPGSTNYAIVPSRTLQNQLKLRETFKVFAPRNSDFQRTSSSSRSATKQPNEASSSLSNCPITTEGFPKTSSKEPSNQSEVA